MDEEEFAECIRSATDSLKRIADALSKDAEMEEFNEWMGQKRQLLRNGQLVTEVFHFDVFADK